MAFEEVMLRTVGGNEYGPTTLTQLQQWQREGRVPANAIVIDMQTRAETPVVSLLPAAAIPPPPTPAMTTGAPMPNGIWSTTDQPAISLVGDRILVVRDGAVLPPICIITGKTDDLVQQRRKEAWAPSWTLLVVLASLLIGAIIRAIVSKYGWVEFSLSRKYAQKRMIYICGNWLFFLTTCIASIAAFADENFGLGFFLMITSIVATMVIYTMSIQLFTVEKIEDGYLTLKFRNPARAQAIYNASLA